MFGVHPSPIHILKAVASPGIYGILCAMNLHHIPWEPIIFGLVKLLKGFGLVPGAMAAYWVRRAYQRWRQNKAMAGWPATDGTIQSGQVHKEGMRHWVELTYTYYAGEYRLGKHVHRFRRESEADEFLRQVKDKRVQVHYDASSPDKSVILDRDLEMVALLAPQFG